MHESIEHKKGGTRHHWLAAAGSHPKRGMGEGDKEFGGSQGWRMKDESRG